MPLVDICGQPLSDCETIDRTTPEEALDNARIAFPNARRHRDTSRSVTRLLSCLNGTPPPPSKRVMIVGHGKPGLIITGTGRVASDEDKRIEMENFDNWQPELARLKDQIQISELTFCSCETGADDQGALLLAAVANEVGARVSGFTAMIFIDGNGSITCETGGQWQHADFGVVPSPIPHPEHPIEDSIVNLRLKDKGDFRTFPISEVSEITYFEPEKREEPKKREEPEKRKWKPRFSLQGVGAQRLVSTVNFAKPAEMKSAPLAVATGRLEIKIRENQVAKAWSFTIYNDRLFQDQSAPDTFYFASRDFIIFVSERLKPSQAQ